MLLTLRCTSPTPDDLGYLLHKHPEKHQTFNVNWGEVHVFYPEVSEQACTAAMLLEIDPVGLVRRDTKSGLDQYVNDRPYAASSFFSVALNQVFKDALLKKCKHRPELVDKPLQLQAELSVVRARGGTTYLQQLFEPLGYEVTCLPHALDATMNWNEAFYYTLTLRAECALHQMLNHLYVLMPVLDAEKHYYVDQKELEKLLHKGEGWLAQHPLKRSIVERYLKRRHHLTREALARLQDEQAEDPEEVTQRADEAEENLEKAVRLHDVRLDRVCELLKESGARQVVDMGCGSGKLLSRLHKFRQFERVIGVDVSYASLTMAKDRLKYQEGETRLQLMHGSLLYHDSRLQGCEAAALVEVIEHLDPPRLEACQRNLFGQMKPKMVVITTPNRDYNALFPGLPAGKFRHRDHRFEWSRDEFQAWSENVCQTFGYRVRYEGLGPEDPTYGCPSQMGVFER